MIFIGSFVISQFCIHIQPNYNKLQNILNVTRLKDLKDKYFSKIWCVIDYETNIKLYKFQNYSES